MITIIDKIYKNNLKYHSYAFKEEKFMKSHDTTTNLQELKDIVKQIAIDRDWQQFHSPKNLALYLSIEAAELLEKFTWMKEEDSYQAVEDNRQEVENEVADVFIVLLAFCNSTKIDLASAMEKKLQEVRKKYPIDKSKGVYKKYDKL